MAYSSSSSHGARQYDVFLSFNGSDTRNNFTGHLYRALKQRGVHTFIDNKLRKGEEISTSLKAAIKESKISIIIFSENYASSSWCLDELVEILKCRQLVLPVFFYVDPSDIRNHRGSFGEALARYTKSCNESKKEKLPQWKIALNTASHISGWHLNDGDNESQLIQKVVEDALKKLNRRCLLHVAEYPVGIEDLLKSLESLIDVAKKDVRFVGVYGMVGIGKTTIAKAIFNKFADKFECSSFLANVKETSKQHLGFEYLQETLLFDMLGDKNLKFGNFHRGINIIKERLCNKRVLLILDDVDECDQLQRLAGHHKWFGSGSRIIITSRNKRLLTTHEAYRIYEVERLNHERALQLFSWNAFKREKPVDQDYLALLDPIVRYADGLPLALEVLGSFLCGRTVDQWQCAIHNLENNKLDKKLYETLKISYDALREDEKALFLDMACFFVGEDKDYVIKLLGSKNYSPLNEIEVLSDMSLIYEEGNRLRMHRLIEEVAKEIVWKESLEASKRSRLWSPDDVFRMFSENTGTNSIQGIMLRLPEQRTLKLHGTSFKKMKGLRLLIFSNVVLSTAIEYLPDKLRLIDLPGYKFRTLPFNSGPKQLVILNMPDNHIRELDKGFKNFESLKVLKFSHSKFLKKIPNLSTAPNLESLYVSRCTSLVEIHKSVGFLTKLVTLDAYHCSKLNIVPSNLVSKYFKTLDFQGCSTLQIFPNLVEEIKLLTSLYLSGTGIKELPSSIDRIVALEKLRLSDCKELVHIPSTIYNLERLDDLKLNGCPNLSQFPNYVQEIHGTFKLRRFGLGKCNISDKDFLLTLFSFPSLEWLDLSGNKFVRLPSVRKIFKLSGLTFLNVSNCRSLVETPWKIMAKMISNDKGFLKDSEIEILLPGSDIPDWFSHKSETKSATFDVPLNMMKNIAAVIICVVFRSKNTQRMDLSFKLFHESYTVEMSLRRTYIWIKPRNMWLIYLPASTLLSECLPYSRFNDTKTSILKKINRLNKIEVSFHNCSSSSRCGIHVLWDGDEIMMERKRIKVSDSISHIIDRDFDDFAETERAEEEEEVNNSSEIENSEEEEKVANSSETELSRGGRSNDRELSRGRSDSRGRRSDGELSRSESRGRTSSERELSRGRTSSEHFEYRELNRGRSDSRGRRSDSRGRTSSDRELSRGKSDSKGRRSGRTSSDRELSRGRRSDRELSRRSDSRGRISSDRELSRGRRSDGELSRSDSRGRTNSERELSRGRNDSRSDEELSRRSDSQLSRRRKERRGRRRDRKLNRKKKW